MVYTDSDDNITDTRLKLEEATYFLDQARINQNKWKFFNFYINAFFSSAYSVPEVMQKEVEKKLKEPKDFYKWAEEANPPSFHTKLAYHLDKKYGEDSVYGQGSYN
jgi:hypothetical protein